MSFADKFNLFNEFNILRIACAVFFIPHIIGKFTVPATLEFFVKAGFKPPATWMYIAGDNRNFPYIGLFLGSILPMWLYRLHPSARRRRRDLRGDGSWIWVIGGVEYCIFWAICCLVVAMHAYHTGN